MQEQNSEVRSRDPEEPRELLPEREDPWKPLWPLPTEDSRQLAVGSPIENPPRSGAPKSEIQNPPLLDLSSPERTVRLRSGERRYMHVFNPPTAEDWMEFERRARATQIFRGDEVETVTRVREAAMELWEKRSKRVEGYDASPVPIEHRVQAVLGLDRVESADDADVAGDSETQVVVLQAWWNGEFFPRLVHRFKRPLVEHELRFSEAAARSTIVLPRGPRTHGGKPDKDRAIESRRVPSLPTLIALYDELIVSVDGYRLPTADCRLPMVMDTPHKSAAVRALFATEAVALDEE